MSINYRCTESTEIKNSLTISGALNKNSKKNWRHRLRSKFARIFSLPSPIKIGNGESSEVFDISRSIHFIEMHEFELWLKNQHGYNAFWCDGAKMETEFELCLLTYHSYNFQFVKSSMFFGSFPELISLSSDSEEEEEDSQSSANVTPVSTPARNNTISASGKQIT